jgi:hypothetical protein
MVNIAVTIRDYGTTVHKRKLVLELSQRGFPTNPPPQWLALYGYLQRVHLSLIVLLHICLGKKYHSLILLE